MFKKLILVSMIVVGLSGCGNKIESKATEIHQYKITEVKGNEIFGKIMGKETFDNAGIILYKGDIDANLNVGDKIEVTFEKGIGDSILDIKKVD